MCLGGSVKQPVQKEVFTPPEIEKYEYEIADILIGDTNEIKKKKQQSQNTTVERNDINI